MIKERLDATRVTPLGQVSAATLAWRVGGQLRLTLVGKATFAIVPEGPMKHVDPQPIVRAEVHHQKSPMRSIRLTSDLAPHLMRTDVLVNGHAVAPVLPDGAGVTSMSVRLALFRESALLDKTVVARSDTPFDRIPLMYEQAYGGIGFEENPLGVGAGGSTAQRPSLVDPADPTKVACFGPIGRSWPARKRLVDAAQRKGLDAPIVEIPNGFDWAYFQAAPLDQRVGPLVGDEWVVLEGMSAHLRQIRSRLPGARMLGRVTDAHGRSLILAMPLDTVWIDADAMAVSLVCRTSLSVAGEAVLDTLDAAIALDLDGTPIAWPAPSASIAPVTSADHAAAPPEKTVFLDDAQPEDGIPVSLADWGENSTMDEGPKLAETVAVRPGAEGGPALPFRAGPASPDVVAHRRTPPPAPPMRPPENPMTLTAAFDLEEDDAPAPLPFARRAPPVVEVVSLPPMPAPAIAPIVEEPSTLDVELVEDKPPVSETRLAPGPPVKLGVKLVFSPEIALDLVPWGDKNRDALTVVAKLVCSIKDGVVTPKPSPEPIHDEIIEGGFVRATDRAPYKTRADVTLVGHARAPGGMASVVEVRFTFGDPRNNGFDRVLLAHGDRGWEKGLAALRPSRPKPFFALPLTYARAFGGPSFDPNPAGIGHPGRYRRGDERSPVPNLEDPAERIRTPNQMPSPACFAPVPLAWKARWASLGQKRIPWSGFPEEMDWTYYHVAPRRQQLRFLRGDEPFSITGVRADGAPVEGALPGLVVRCHAERGDAPPEPLEMNLDTVAFDVDEATVTLLFRGTIGVLDERAPDVGALYAKLEPVTS